jgi:glutamine phosphoribosylpyrophosphate amidotransferase
MFEDFKDKILDKASAVAEKRIKKSMKKFEKQPQEEIRYNENPSAERNSIMVDSEISMIKESIEPNSVILIDGPLIGRQASTKMVKMDREMRAKNSAVALPKLWPTIL